MISNAFRENLLDKGVPPWKVKHIYNPYTRDLGGRAASVNGGGPARVLYMGNMGFSQNLPALVRAFELSPVLDDQARLVLAGTASWLERSPPRSGPHRVEMPGLLLEGLESELERATIGLVPQRPDVDEFILPSKLMNLMSRGVPVLASVSPSSEIARIVRESGAGWVVDAADPDAFPNALQEILPDREELERRGARGLEFAAATSRRTRSPAGSRTCSTTSCRRTAIEREPRVERSGDHRVHRPDRIRVCDVLGELGLDVVGIDNDMRRVFFGPEASTAWNRDRLEGARRRLPPPLGGHPGPRRDRGDLP